MTMQAPAEQASPDRTLTIELRLTGEEYQALRACADRCGYLIETAASFYFFLGLQAEQLDGRLRECTEPQPSQTSEAGERGEA